MHPLPDHLALALESQLATDWHHACPATRRAALFVSFGLYGLRLTETRNLRRTDLDADANLLYVRSLKRGTPRRLQLHIDFVTAVLDHYNRFARPAAELRADAADYLVPSLRGGRLRKATAHAWADHYLKPLGDYSYHSLRHTAALRVWYATENILAVMRLLGHSTLKQTHVYLQTVVVPDRVALPQWRRARSQAHTAARRAGRPAKKPAPNPPDSQEPTP